ncbi:geranylgeranyl reductase family protein [Haloactinopolyspora sp.]|uniref:NAD(P)/FAD-dependent oxidoreductase n=1 Tax=Haloactinopolyspora sp. TaxID=1966353 RepID=UPI0026043251|nr:geranylgeranyl reductase family protein [Haloactinopolyspora sp.]
MNDQWDVVVVGAGPAGAAAALAVLASRPHTSVLLLDRARFPRDKACGDGIAAHAVDVLAAIGVPGVVDDDVPVARFDLTYGAARVTRPMARPAWVVPRTTFDARLADAAVASGAVLRHHRVRTVRCTPDAVMVDDTVRARVLIGADGAYSAVRRAIGAGPTRRRAFALRGYAPTPPARAGRQSIVFASASEPAYAWSFDIGDGWSNVGYGLYPSATASTPSRQMLQDHLEQLLPGSTRHATAWRGHHLPLSSWRWSNPRGSVLLAGDAAGLVNPLTGEGIYYAVATGALAGRAAATALATGRPAAAGAAYRSRVRSALGRHLRHTSTVARLARVPTVLRAGVRAAADEQELFDDLVEVGLGRGLVTARLVTGLVRHARGPWAAGAGPSGSS